jgi:S-DNA-T family DNA segregation ATPase FtsK/SpoIIIE
MRDDMENLPAVPSDDVEESVLEGEIVDDAPRQPAVRMTATVIGIVRHEHTQRAGRHAGYIGLGAAVVVRRMWMSRTTSRFDKWLRAAQAAGNHDAAVKWEELRQKFLADRHKRRMERRESALNTFRALPFIVFGFVMVLFTIGMFLAIAESHVSEVAAPFEVVAHIIMWVAIAVSVSYGPLFLAAPWIALAALWQVGRTAAASEGPAWLRTSADDEDVTIDERTIAQALEAMRIPQIRDYLKQGLPLQFITPCRIDGRGTYAEIRLPKVPAEKIVRRRADFAAGLYRLPKEVWPSMGSEAAILKVWIADKGALEEGAGPYPLLEEGFTDVFRGLPFGKTLRGEPSKIPVIGRNTIAGGIPEQGKSNGARVVACGYTLDITTELRIYVPDTNFDFEHFEPRCSRYVMGAEDEHIERILADLEELKGELQQRGQLLVDYEVQEVTREIAHAGVGLHPVFVLLEEAHVAIQHKKFGKDISQLLCDIVKLDRKRGVHLMVSTQAPTKDSMPRDVTRNCANGIAFAVGDHVANDALLGQGAYRAGHRATELIPGTDRGTALCKGFSGERSEMVQVHRIQASRDSDQVTPLVERSLKEMARLGRGVPGTGRERVIESRDLLADLDAVLDGDDRVRLTDVPARLRKLAPAWSAYRGLDGVQLRKLLDAEKVRTTNPKNVPMLDPADLRRVLAERGELDGAGIPGSAPERAAGACA